MAIATSTAIALALMAAGTGLQYKNTQDTLKRQDATAADGIRRQGVHQREADAKVNAEVEKLKASSAEDERARAQGQYMDALRKRGGNAQAGLDTAVGSDAFREGAAEAATGVQQYGRDRAGLMARIDAPGLQRQGEAFGYGRLGTDLGLIGRESSGDNFINELRLRSIRRNAGKDLLAGLMTGGGGALLGAGSGASSGSPGAVEWQPIDGVRR